MPNSTEMKEKSTEVRGVQKDLPKEKTAAIDLPKAVQPAHARLTKLLVEFNVKIQSQMQRCEAYKIYFRLSYAEAKAQMSKIFTEAGLWLEMGLDGRSLLLSLIVDIPAEEYESYINQFFKNYQHYIEKINFLLTTKLDFFSQLHLKIYLCNAHLILQALFEKEPDFPTRLNQIHPKFFNEKIHSLREICNTYATPTHASDPLFSLLQHDSKMMIYNQRFCFEEYRKHVGDLSKKIKTLYDSSIVTGQTESTSPRQYSPVEDLYLKFNFFFTKSLNLIQHVLQICDRGSLASALDGSMLMQRYGTLRVIVIALDIQIAEMRTIIKTTLEYCELYSKSSGHPLTILALFANHMEEILSKISPRFNNKTGKLDEWRVDCERELRARPIEVAAVEDLATSNNEQSQNNKASGTESTSSKKGKKNEILSTTTTDQPKRHEKSTIIRTLHTTYKGISEEIDNLLGQNPSPALGILEAQQKKLQKFKKTVHDTARKYELSAATTNLLVRKCEKANDPLAKRINQNKTIPGDGTNIENADIEKKTVEENKATPPTETPKTRQKKKKAKPQGKGTQNQGKKQGKKPRNSTSGIIPQDGSEDESDQAKEEAKAKKLEDKKRADSEAEAKAKSDTKAPEDKKRTDTEAEAKAFEDKRRADAEAEAKALEDKKRADAEVEAKVLEDKRRADAEVEAKALEDKKRADAEVEAKVLEDKRRADAEVEAKALEDKKRADAEEDDLKNQPPKAPLVFSGQGSGLGATAASSPELNPDSNASSAARTPISLMSTTSQESPLQDPRADVPMLDLNQGLVTENALIQNTDDKKQKSENAMLLIAYRATEQQITNLNLEANRIIRLSVGYFDWGTWNQARNLFRQAYMVAKQSANDFLIKDTHKHYDKHLKIALGFVNSAITYFTTQQTYLQVNTPAYQENAANLNSEINNHRQILREIQVLETELAARQDNMGSTDRRSSLK